MSKKNLTTLSKEEIEEELINNDLMGTGGVENQEQLEEMSVEEKKNLLKGITKPKEFRSEVPQGSKSSNQSVIDTSTLNFPKLPSAGKSNKQNKLRLPRRQNSKSLDCDIFSDNTIILIDDEDTVVKFKLPYFVDDGAPAMVMPERQMELDENPYYVMDGESPEAALKRMICHHDAWKAAYTAEMSRIKSQELEKDVEDSDIKEQRVSLNNDEVEDKEKDAYSFSPDSPVQLFEDSDWKPTRHKNKRNRKQPFNKEKSQTYEASPSVNFSFERKWESRASTWRNSSSPSSSSINNQGNRSLSNTPVVEEEKVQCPICQRSFALSKVENHAATCEGFSDSPMDVEEES